MGDGTAPYHWILDEAGALIVADRLGRDRAEFGWRHSVAVSIATSQNLAHHVEANEFFARLASRPTLPAARCRSGMANEPAITRSPESRSRWLGRPHAPGAGAAASLGRARPRDRASSRLRKKAADYEESLPNTSLKDLDPLVLLLVPGATRARTARAAVARSAAPIATAVWTRHSACSALASVVAADASLRRAKSAPRQTA
jgi:hypothetical protein